MYFNVKYIQFTNVVMNGRLGNRLQTEFKGTNAMNLHELSYVYSRKIGEEND